MSTSQPQTPHASQIQGLLGHPYLAEVADAGQEVVNAYARHYIGSVLRRQLPSYKKKKADAKLAATLFLMENVLSKLDHTEKVHLRTVYNQSAISLLI